MRARERAASGVRAASTLFCFCSRAAWSRLFDISDMPKSCAEKTGGARVRNNNNKKKMDGMEEPAEIGGKKGRNGGSEGRKEKGIHGLIRHPSRGVRGTGQGRAHLQVLEVLEDPLPALLLVGRAGGGCAARLRRHIPAALPTSLSTLTQSLLPPVLSLYLSARQRSEKATVVGLFFEFFSRERKERGGGERPLAFVVVGIRISNSK